MTERLSVADREDTGLPTVGFVVELIDQMTEEARTATHVPDLMVFADDLPELARAVGSFRAAVEGRVHDLLHDLGGSLELADGRVLKPSFRSARVRSDGARIRGVLGAQLRREWESEGVHPVEWTDHVLDVVAECAGLDNASQNWRKGVLGRRGIPLERFQESENGPKTFRVFENGLPS